ncbi:response regulator receiver protein [Candidatus Vecturithrix granuli]|uniref:Response regulator receiver protein n=1 Tax=Vecturithrix granuli TaxID=1499967 RepID=A0A081BVD0_VECG1|nr:response regulator receiver protein [Candidatus Vecturithrix granuli]
MRQKTVLIADDSPTVVKMLSYMLSSLPCDVISASDGVEAIKLCYSAHPDLILLDILMPRMNGYQVCRLLKDDEQTKQIPIIMLTAKDQQSDRFWGLATGADEYIVKDFEDDHLIETIGRILQQDLPQTAPTAERKLKEISTVDLLSHANNLLDQQLYQSTITNRINQLARSIQNFEETLTSVFELLSRILTFQLGAISVLRSQSTRLRIYFYLPDRASHQMIEQAKLLLLSEFSRTPAVQNVETFFLHGTVDTDSDWELKSHCESVLIGRNKKIGSILLGDSRKGRFSDNDRETFRIAGTEAAVVIDNARLYDDNARIHAELERELRRAHDIQKLMLPQDNPLEKYLSIEATSIPAKEVGGDYYDYYPLNDHQLLLAIGDVTGKGVPAALMMATIKTALQIRLELTSDVSEIMMSLNKLVCHQATRQYMTFFLGIIDINANTITYCNAGHNFPYLISGQYDTLTYLEYSSLPLGFVPHDAYLARVQHFENDDILFFYTDGIIEALNAERELFGYPRLEKLLLSHYRNDLITIQLKILETIAAFCHETPQDDDMTMVLIQKTPR